MCCNKSVGDIVIPNLVMGGGRLGNLGEVTGRLGPKRQVKLNQLKGYKEGEVILFQTKETICANFIKQNRAFMGGMGEVSRNGWERLRVETGVVKIADLKGRKSILRSLAFILRPVRKPCWFSGSVVHLEAHFDCCVEGRSWGKRNMADRQLEGHLGH